MQGAARKGCQGVPGTCMCVMFMLEWLVPSHIQYIKRYQKIHVWHFIDQLNIDVALRSTLVHGLFSHSVWFLDARIRFHLVDIVGGMEATAVKGPCPRHSMHCLQMNPDGPHKLFKRLPGFRLSSCSSFRARSKAKSTVPGPVPVTKVLVAQATAEI